jgi:signal transduction histidine kinase
MGSSRLPDEQPPQRSGDASAGRDRQDRPPDNRPDTRPDTRQRRRLGKNLSERILILTILFVMIAEVMIYVPSVANFRNVWLNEKLESAAIAAIAASAADNASLPADLQRRMLAAIGVEAIAIRSEGQRWLIASGDMPAEVADHHDLTGAKPLDSIRAAFSTLFFGGERMVMVAGRPPAGSDRFEIVIQEAALRNALLVYSRNILLLSLAISMITASLVYLALKAMIVRPIQRLTTSMVAFSEAPEDASRVIRPTQRADEIGLAEEQLAAMQNALRETLHQRKHLADLGLAVSKINHDLRNILASAQLFSDRLAMTDDPMAKRLTPKLVGAIDRAVAYTRSVLSYGQALADILGLPDHQRIAWENRIADDLEVDADPDQLFRVIMNLGRNAIDALDQDGDPNVIRRLWLEGERNGGVMTLRVCDTGPGVPKKARNALFQAFQGSARPGGTGLGLAIAAEIVRAHGGDIALVDRPGAGAVFQITIPDRPVDIRAARKAQGA